MAHKLHLGMAKFRRQENVSILGVVSEIQRFSPPAVDWFVYYTKGNPIDSQTEVKNERL